MAANSKRSPLDNIAGQMVLACVVLVVGAGIAMLYLPKWRLST